MDITSIDRVLKETERVGNDNGKNVMALIGTTRHDSDSYNEVPYVSFV